MPSITGLIAAEGSTHAARQGNEQYRPSPRPRPPARSVRDNICTYFNLVFLVLAVMLALVRPPG